MGVLMDYFAIRASSSFPKIDDRRERSIIALPRLHDYCRFRLQAGIFCISSMTQFGQIVGDIGNNQSSLNPNSDKNIQERNNNYQQFYIHPL